MQNKKSILAIISSLVIPSHAHAAIVYSYSDNGTDLTLTITGTLNTSGDGGGNSGTSDLDFINAASMQGGILDGSHYTLNNLGTLTGADPVILGMSIINSPSLSTGAGVYFQNSVFLWDDSFGANPDSITVNATTVFTGETVASVFGTNLDAGPVDVWTHTSSGETISFQRISSPVPEPSSALLLSFAGVGFAVRRRRK